MKRRLSVLLILTFLLSLLAGCGGAKVNDGENESATDSEKGTSASVAVDFSKTDSDMFTDSDYETDCDHSKAVMIQLKETTATASSDSVKILGSTVQITEEATYVISGSLTDGMIVVDAGDTAKVQLVLNGVDITCKTSAALYISEADKVFVTLAEGTKNALSNGGSFAAIDESNIDAAVFSRQDLTLNGSGSLTVTSPAGHGIVCKDDLVVTGGKYVISSAGHGLDANDSVRIANADFTVNAGKDAVHCENTDDAAKGFIYMASGSIQAEAEGDGIAASAYLQITGGEIDLLTGGGFENGGKTSSDYYGGFRSGPGGMGEKPGSANAQDTATEESTSMKGLKAANSMLISGGKITVNSADDAIHSDASVIINGGTFSLSSGDDAIHAEDTLTVTAGAIDISQSYEGLEALHIDICGGDIRLTADDDGLNAAGGVDQSGVQGGRDGMFGGGKGGRPGGGGMSANSDGSIKISGGTVYVIAYGDGIDANGTLEITGGHITVTGPVGGDTATLDYDVSAVISAGTFIGTGGAGMAQSFSDSGQGVVALQVGSQTAGTEVILQDADGKTLLHCKPELDFAVVILSGPDIVKGQTYTVTVGTLSGTFEAG